jgi:hypothetical protein
MSRDETALAEAVRAMRDRIRLDVAAGFDPADQIAGSAAEVECVDGVDAEELEGIARRLVREALADHYREQATWPDRTDCDRLDDAFAELEGRGIVCRQNFSCCGNCGVTEIGDEIADAEDAGVEVRGYAFYHMQSTESAVEGYGVMLHYGAAEDGEAAALAVARELVEVLAAHGLKVDWNGSWDRCVGVALDWKRRRPLEVGPEGPRPTPGLFDDCE